MTINIKPCNPANCGQGRGIKAIEYIVMHYTANKGDTAKNNADYFAREVVKASAHFFVDENEVWQSVPPSRDAWHCGGGLQGSGGHAFYQKCRNGNSIGVELCLLDKSGDIRHGTIERAADLVRELMERYGVDGSHVIRHFDVTGKNCPAPMVSDPWLWQAFKARLEADEMRYKYYEDMPAWAKPTVSKLVRLGLLKGEGDGVLDLSEDVLKVLVINDRAGVYGK